MIDVLSHLTHFTAKTYLCAPASLIKWTLKTVHPVTVSSVSNQLFNQPFLSQQFTFDKDGKVIDATLPLVSGMGRKRMSSGKFSSCLPFCLVIDFQM